MMRTERKRIPRNAILREGRRREKNILKIIIKEMETILAWEWYGGTCLYTHARVFFPFLKKKINLGMKLVVIHNFVRFWR